MQLIKANSLQEVLKVRADTGYPILAGGTDLMAQWKSGAPKPEGIIDIWNINELKQIREADGKIEVGALATHSDIIKSEPVQKHAPALSQACATIGAVQIQNRGTIGGNVMNASPAGDTLPVLLAYDAEVELASLTGMRRVPFEKFFIGYRKTTAKNDEIVTKFIIPLTLHPLPSGERAGVRGYDMFIKIGTRQAQAISKVCGCFRLVNDVGVASAKGGPASGGGLLFSLRELAHPKGCYSKIIIAFGSVAPVPIRCRKTEEFLNSNPPSPPFVKGGWGGFNEVLNILQQEISPIDDIRSTAEYRKHVCGVMLKRFLNELANRSGKFLKVAKASS